MSAFEFDVVHFIDWPWSRIEPYLQDLERRRLDSESVATWLSDWSAVAERLDETNRRLEVATTQNTADAEAERRYHEFLQEIQPRAEAASQRLKEKLLASGLEPPGFDVQLRKMRAEAALFRAENLALLAEERTLNTQYDALAGAQVVEWEGQEIPSQALRPYMQSSDRAMREHAWRLDSDRWLQDRDAINALWTKLYDLRRRIAANAGMPDFRAYQWQVMKRFDYAPEDCKQFHASVSEVVTPVVRRILEQRRGNLGVETLRPWDILPDPKGREPLRPFRDIGDLEERTSRIFHRVDPRFGEYFDTMRRRDLLDLDTRKNKGAGGYCLPFNASKVPFIFLSVTGMHGDVQGLLHEGGHAFHSFEMQSLPYFWQRDMETVGVEFAEVASTAMELLAAPYLAEREGGFYSEEDTARARIENLKSALVGMSYIAMIDNWQHWAYDNPDLARDTEQCDTRCRELQAEYIPGVDWSGLETEAGAWWQQVSHIFAMPFYYIEYGLSQLGALQIWAAAQEDQAGAVRRYQEALALGDTRPIPELYRVAGAKFAFDAGTMRESVDLVERTLEELEKPA